MLALPQFLKKAALATYHLLNGPRVFREYLINNAKTWDVAADSGAPGSVRSSISDTESYLEICKLASNEPRVFANFKSAFAYKAILEHTGFHHGRSYEKILLDRGVSPAREFLDLHSAVGNPETFTFKGFGKVSPSLLRYFKVASDLEIFFPGWKNRPIVEVGIGYGGQLAVMSNFGFVGRYFGIDLPEAGTLAKKYLEQTDVRLSDCQILDNEQSVPALSDYLFLSNYAFSELQRDVQERYFQKLVSSSTSGYVTWNDLAEKAFGGMPAREFAERVGGVIHNEEPLTHPGNCIITWGRERDSK